MTKHEARERLIHRVAERVRRATQSENTSQTGPVSRAEFVDAESSPYTPSNTHHTIAKSQNNVQNIYTLLAAHPDDPALKV